MSYKANNNQKESEMYALENRRRIMRFGKEWKGGMGKGQLMAQREATSFDGLVSLELLQITIIYHIYQKKYFDCSRGGK